MAKTAKFKKRSTAPNSRAARRATSPSLDVDKSLKSIKAPEENSGLHGAALAMHTSSRVSKRNKQRPLSRQQRLRREKMVERAGIVTGRLDRKLAQSKKKDKRLKERRANWDELNGRVMLIKQEEMKVHGEGEVESNETEAGTIEAGTSPKVPATWTQEVVIPQHHDKTAALATGNDELDEIL